MGKTEYAIIVAGGKGSRMQHAIPKQFLQLVGQPILIHTLNAFFDYSEHIHVILVLPEQDMDTWRQLATDHQFTKPIKLVKGGTTRFQSVKNGLNAIENDSGLVAIHDGVRPLISKDVIATSFELAAIHKSAIATVPLKESLRKKDQQSSHAVDRSAFCLVQTPQTFDLKLIKEAYRLPEEATMTDDASVMERAGHTVFLFEGQYSNIKITTPEDLIIARALLNSEKSS